MHFCYTSHKHPALGFSFIKRMLKYKSLSSLEVTDMDQAQFGRIALCYMHDWLESQCTPVGPENVALAARIMRAASVTQTEARAFLANPCSEHIAFCFVQDLLQHQKGPAGPENKVLVDRLARVAAVDTDVAAMFLSHMKNNCHAIV